MAGNDAAERVGLGFAIGGSVFDPAHPITADELARAADQAMYEEKEDKGR